MKYNVAIVGCGGMGVENIFENFPFTYSFTGAILKNPATELVALVDIDKAKLENIIYRLKAEGHIDEVEGYTSLDGAILEAKRRGDPIDIVCCAGGPKVNAEIIRQAKSLGIRGIYCEKPLALSLPEADELVRIEAEEGIKIQVNYLRNFETFHVSVLDCIRNGGIGDVLIARVLYKGGVLAVAPHGIALLNLLFGRPLWACGQYSPLTNGRCPEDPNIDGIIQYHLGLQDRDVNVSIMATGRGEIENNTYLFEVELTGTKGRISVLENGWRLRYEEMQPSRVFGSLGEMMPYETERVPLSICAGVQREFMIDGLQDLLDAIEKNRPAMGSAKIARDAEEVAHALAISAKDRLPLGLPLEGDDRMHQFLGSVSGINILKKEAGIK